VIASGKRWLNAPHRTNRHAIVAGILASLATLALLYAGGLLLDVVDVVDFDGTAPVWLAGLITGAALGGGFVLGRAGSRASREEVRTYDRYAEHLRDALADLRRTFGEELPDFSLRDFVENGVFQPAQRLLVRRGARGDVRFSILHPSADGTTWLMADDRTGLFPALGHSLESRQNYSLAIEGSFSELAYRGGRMAWSNHLQEDERFRTHPRARAGRKYDSIVSVPLWSQGEVDGVLNVIASESEAFSPIDRTYITLLASVIDVARSVD
jgi:GAF domain-containing protein